MEHPVGQYDYGSRGRGALRATREKQPRMLELEDRLEVVGLEEVALRGFHALHRLRIGRVEAEPVLDRGVGAGKHLHVIAEPLVLADLLPKARADLPLPRGIVNLDDRSRGAAREAGLVSNAVAHEDAHEPG